MLKRCLLLLTLIIGAGMGMTGRAFAQAQVVPCQLTNADQDSLRLFPTRTNYRLEFMRTDEVGDKRGGGGEALFRELEKRLGDKWDPIWETKDIPYVFYEVLQGQERLGWVFGANQGWPGADNSQLMAAFNNDGRLLDFYYQKLPSLEKAKLQTPEFYGQFIGLNLAHFYVHDGLEGLGIPDKNLLALDMISRIEDPTVKEREGFLKTLRGLKKVLLYLDDFKMKNTIKKDETLAKVTFLKEHAGEVDLLAADALPQLKQFFPAADRFVVDLVSLPKQREALAARLGTSWEEKPEQVYPVYLAYQDEVYQKPFVRGKLLGYVLPLRLKTAAGASPLLVAIGAGDKEKGKIQGFTIQKTAFDQFKGLSLVNFYAKEVLSKRNQTNAQLDKIGPLPKVQLNGQDLTPESKITAEKALLIIDEVYFKNFFKKEEISRKIEDYLNKQKK